MKALEKIISILTTDSAVEMMRRMVRLNTQVRKRVFKEGESIKEYVARFKTTALAYLNPARHGPDSSDSQVFARKLIINANLLSKAFYNILNEIQNNTSMKNNKDQCISIKPDRLNGIIIEMKNRHSEVDENVKECIKTAEAARDIRCNTNQDDGEYEYISLQDAIKHWKQQALSTRT